MQAPGWLEAEPFSIACTALADGVVETIEVLEGDRVEQGQVVATLVAEDSTLRLRRAEAGLETALAQLAAAQAEHDAAERAWDDPVELERAVASGRASLAEAQAELAQLPALIESARATLVQFQEEADRVGRSTQRGATNELEQIEADQRLSAQRASVTALEARRGILDARIDRLRADLRAAERDLELRIADRRRLELAAAALDRARSEVRHAEVARDEAALELERMTIRAPISGYVQRRLKVPGDKVMRQMDSEHSAHLVHLYDPERLQVRADIPLADASHVSVGQACEVVVEVLPDRVFRGEVLRITHQADLQKNTLQAKVRVIDPDPILRPEMLTRVKFLGSNGSGAADRGADASSNARSVVTVPSRAVDRSAESPRLWLVTDRGNGSGVLAQRRVAVVEEDDGWARVSGEVQPGALIAVGLAEPREGERVEFRASEQGGDS